MDLLPVVIVVIFLALVVIVGNAVLSRGKSSTGKGGKKGRKIKAKDHAQILREANRRLAQNPKDPEALAALGDVYFAEQSWDKSYKAYETLLEAAAGNP